MRNGGEEMRLDQDALESMVWKEYRALERRMNTWVSAAEAELESEEAPREIIFAFLFWANGEFQRRRRYMGQEEPETERHAKKVLWALSEKLRKYEREP